MKNDFLRSSSDSTQRGVVGRPSHSRTVAPTAPSTIKEHRRLAQEFAVRLNETFTTKWILRWWWWWWGVWILRSLLLTNGDPRSSATCQGHAASPGSGRGLGLALGEGLEVDGQGLFLRVRRTSELVLGDQVAQQHPKNHQQDPQDVGQHPLWSELGVGWPTESSSTNKQSWGFVQAATPMICWTFVIFFIVLPHFLNGEKNKVEVRWFITGQNRQLAAGVVTHRLPFATSQRFPQLLVSVHLLHRKGNNWRSEGSRILCTMQGLQLVFPPLLSPFTGGYVSTNGRFTCFDCLQLPRIHNVVM